MLWTKLIFNRHQRTSRGDAWIIPTTDKIHIKLWPLSKVIRHKLDTSRHKSSADALRASCTQKGLKSWTVFSNFWVQDILPDCSELDSVNSVGMVRHNILQPCKLGCSSWVSWGARKSQKRFALVHLYQLSSAAEYTLHFAWMPDMLKG